MHLDNGITARREIKTPQIKLAEIGERATSGIRSPLEFFSRCLILIEHTFVSYDWGVTASVHPIDSDDDFPVDADIPIRSPLVGGPLALFPRPSECWSKQNLAPFARFLRETAQMITRVAVDAAYGRIRKHVRRTPVMDFDGVTLKLELFQHSGSFKARGSFNSALAQGVPNAGLIAASGGNHGIAVAHVARELGVRAEIYVPATSSPVKIARIRALGADVHVGGDLYADAQAACDRRIAESGALAIHPFDEPLTVAGQGTIGIELEQQIEGLDTVVVATGGGGLAAGIAAALPDVKIVCVEPRRCCCLHEALAAGEPVAVEIDSIAADSLGARQIGAVPWTVLRDRANSVLVDDEAIVAARQSLWDQAQIVAEHGGATAYAAIQSGAYSPADGEKVAVVICGANTDPADLVG